jgi:hypothetical protein
MKPYTRWEVHIKYRTVQMSTEYREWLNERFYFPFSTNSGISDVLYIFTSASNGHLLTFLS